MIEWKKTIAGAVDAELDILRSGAVTYHCSAQSRSADGLIFVIHGFGEDTNAEYDQKLRRFIAEKSNMLVVCVEYHCYHSRPPRCSIDIPGESLERLGYLLGLHQIHIPLSGENIPAALNELGRKTAVPIQLKASLVPPNGDYQNFGVLQALDHLAVLNDIIDDGFSFDKNKIILFGSSHGAYIAHLVAKLAPNTILGIIDNSAYTLADPKYLGQGGEFYMVYGNLLLECGVVTQWRFGNVYEPNYYGPSRAIFRDTGHLAHLMTAAKVAERKCQYRMFNSAVDTISPVEQKRAQMKNLRKAGFDASLKEITPADIDGALFKSMAHGDVSLQKLFAHSFDSIENRSTILDRDLATAMSFDCFDTRYAVIHSGKAPYLELRVSRVPEV